MPSKKSKETTAAASIIKNKILNTSSFFKVSLKTNNRQLALSLAAQRAQNTQLETEVVHLMKKVDSLSFELAALRFKDKKLRLILNNLHAYILQHFYMAADLFRDCDLPELSEGQTTQPGGKEREEGPQAEGLADQVPPLLESLCSTENVISNVPEKLPDENPFCIQSMSRKLTADIFKDAEKRHVTLTETSCPFSQLRDEVERLFVASSQSDLDMRSLPVSHSSGASASRMCESKAASSGTTNEPEPPTADVHSQVNTLLLNSTMELTQSHPVEIVSVQTKVNKKREESCVSPAVENTQVMNSADSGTGEVQSALTEAQLQTDKRAAVEVQSRKNPTSTSRTPKLNKVGSVSHRKPSKRKPPQDTKASDVLSLDFDDVFTDSVGRSSGKLPWEATLAPRSRQQDFDLDHNVPDQAVAADGEFQKPKKARTKDAGRSSKKKARKEADDGVGDKKRSKTARSAKGFTDENEEPCDVQGTAGTNPDGFNDSLVAEPDQDVGENIFSDPKLSPSEKSKPSSWSRNTRGTFVVYRRKTRDSRRTFDMLGVEAARQTLGDMLADEMPPWSNMDASVAGSECEEGSAPAASRASSVYSKETSSDDLCVEAARVLTSLTNTVTTPGSDGGCRSRRCHSVVSYKEPSIKGKLRRGDTFTDTTLLTSPVYKDGKRRKKKKEGGEKRIRVPIEKLVLED